MPDPTAAQYVPDAESAPPAYRPSYELAAEQILELVAARGLQPGDRLPTELDLAQALGFGRSVVREAVKILSALGRIRVRKGAGLYVADEPSPLGVHAASAFIPADLGHLTMLFEFRSTLDAQAARWAAARATPPQLRALEDVVRECRAGAENDDRGRFDAADEAFHRAVVTAAGNMFLESAQAALRTLQGQAAVLGLRGALGGSMPEAARAHEAIFTAIRSGRPEEAAAAARAHVERTWTGYQDEIRRRIFGDARRS